MKSLFFALALMAFPACTFAQDDLSADTESASKLHVSYEAEADYSYVGDARTRLGDGRTGPVSEQSDFAHFVVTPQWGDGPLYRFGLEWQRYSFGLPRLARLPNTLQSINAVIGADLQLFQSWLVRAEAQPGVYSDFHDVGSGDFNVPFLIGGSYIASADLQWVLGVSVDVNREWPVIPAVGVRWGFHDHWVLNLVLPSPRLEFAYSKTLTLFAGGDFKGATYRVDENFGTSHGKPALNDAIVEYDEVRVGGGAVWKASHDLTLEAEGGYMPFREFNFHRAETRFRTENGAPYGQLSLHGKF